MEIINLGIHYSNDSREWTIEIYTKEKMPDGYKVAWFHNQTPQQVELARKAQRALARRSEQRKANP